MRSYGALQPTDQTPRPPDSVQTLFMTGGSSAQAIDWPSTLSQLVEFTGMTSAGAEFGYTVNLVSTHAAVPSSGSSVTTGTTAGSTGNNLAVVGTARYQIPAWSTGWSAAAFSSGYVQAKIWRL